MTLKAEIVRLVNVVMFKGGCASKKSIAVFGKNAVNPGKKIDERMLG